MARYSAAPSPASLGWAPPRPAFQELRARLLAELGVDELRPAAMAETRTAWPGLHALTAAARDHRTWLPHPPRRTITAQPTG